MRVARKAGHIRYRFSGPKHHGRSNSRFGRGRFVGVARRLSRTQRRVVIKARVVRHRGQRYRSAPLSKHVAYLRRDGVAQVGRDATMFGPHTDQADEHGFAARCEEDRHHFRFSVSPEDAGQMQDLHAFGTELDWIAVDHWNTDNPQVHVLVRGKADDGKDLVISRDYIGRGLRARAEELVGLELGPRGEREIVASLEAEVRAERWTELDRALRSLADDAAGVADLRPGVARAA